MSIRPSSDGTTVVNTRTKWLKINEDTPCGVKLQLIRKADGVAHYGPYTKSDKHHTHWFPLPVFDKDET